MGGYSTISYPEGASFASVQDLWIRWPASGANNLTESLLIGRYRLLYKRGLACRRLFKTSGYERSDWGLFLIQLICKRFAYIAKLITTHLALVDSKELICQDIFSIFS